MAKRTTKQIENDFIVSKNFVNANTSITSIKEIAIGVGLTVSQVRTSLERHPRVYAKIKQLIDENVEKVKAQKLAEKEAIEAKKKAKSAAKKTTAKKTTAKKTTAKKTTAKKTETKKTDGKKTTAKKTETKKDTKKDEKTTASTVTISRLKKYKPDEIKEIRKTTGYSIKNFAGYMGVSEALVKAWENGDEQPEGPACRILAMMDMDEEFTEKYVFVRKKKA